MNHTLLIALKVVSFLIAMHFSIAFFCSVVITSLKSIADIQIHQRFKLSVDFGTMAKLSGMWTIFYLLCQL